MDDAQFLKGYILVGTFLQMKKFCSCGSSDTWQLVTDLDLSVLFHIVHVKERPPLQWGSMWADTKSGMDKNSKRLLHLLEEMC